MVVNSITNVRAVLLLSMLGIVSMVGASKFNPIETLFLPRLSPSSISSNQSNLLEEQDRPKQFIPPIQDPFAPTPEEREAERMARRERSKERLAKIHKAMMKVQPSSEGLERVSKEEFEAMQQQHPEFRRLWGGSSGNTHMIDYADPGDDYDMWQQAYRMLGGFIDCDHQKRERSGDRNGNGNGNAQSNGACSRWMMWASVSSIQNGDNAVGKCLFRPLSSFFCSMLTLTIKDTDMMNTLVMNLLEY
jgi:hypothetical protein